MSARKAALEGFSSLPPRRTGQDDPGHRLKKIRERLQLTFRDVEQASFYIASRQGNDEFLLQLSRLSDIENKGTTPSIFRLYSLCTIYRLDVSEILGWYGVDLAQQPADAASVLIEKTHLIGFGSNTVGEIQVPLALDPGLDTKRTSFLSRLIQKWGKLPLTLLSGLDMSDHRYALIGSDDWSMYPLIRPSSLVLIDQSQRKIVNSGWSNEYERPIYFLEHRFGFACGWCTLSDGQLVRQPHPSSACSPEVYRFPDDIDVVGQVTGVAMSLDPGRRRQVRV